MDQQKGVRGVSKGILAITSSLDQLRLNSRSDFAAVGLLDASKHKLSWSYLSGSVSERTMQIVQKSNVGLTGTAIRTGRPSKSTAVATVSERFKLGEPIMLTEQLHMAVSLPVLSASQLACILFLGRRSSDQFSAEELNYAYEQASNLIYLLFREKDH